MMRNLLFVLLILLAGESSQAAEPLGRLFFTPAQRDRLDAGKRLSDSTGPVRRGPAAVTLNGVVLRSDGESTIWVNGEAVTGGKSADLIATPTSDPSSVRVKVPGSVSKKLRVGQHLDTRTGGVSESFALPPRASAAGAKSDDLSSGGMPEGAGHEAQASQRPAFPGSLGEQ
jgi:hypothetical protein